MTAQPLPAHRSLSVLDFGSLLFLGAVWGAVFLFMRVATPEVGPVWAAEIRLAIGAALLLVFAGRRTVAVARGRVTSFVIVGALFSAIPFTLISYATVTLPAGFTALLNAATPLFTAMIGVAFLGQRIGLRRLSVLKRPRRAAGDRLSENELHSVGIRRIFDICNLWHKNPCRNE